MAQDASLKLSRKSLLVWNVIGKQVKKSNGQTESANRFLGNIQTLLKQANGQNSILSSRIIQNLEDINETLVEGFHKIPEPSDSTKIIVVQQDQKAIQFQQLALRIISTAPATEASKKEEEKATKVNWWKGLKEGKGNKENKPDNFQTTETLGKKALANTEKSNRNNINTDSKPAVSETNTTQETNKETNKETTEKATDSNSQNAKKKKDSASPAESKSKKTPSRQSSDVKDDRPPKDYMMDQILRLFNKVKSLGEKAMAPLFDTGNLKSSEGGRDAETKKRAQGNAPANPASNLNSNTTAPSGQVSQAAPKKDSKVMNFLKTADIAKPFNAIKSFGEKAVTEAATDEDKKNWNTMNENIDKALGQIGAKAMGALRPVMDTINTALTSGQLAPLIDAMANGFLVIANTIGMVVDGLLWLAGIIQENWSFIKPILEAIAIVYLAAMIVQVYMLAAAWLAANWPILLVIAVIAVLLMILQKLGVSASEVVGAIVGAFGVLVAVVQNIGIWISNMFYLVCDGIINAFNNAVYNVRDSLHDLASRGLNILYSLALGAEGFAGGFMKVMAEAINWVLGRFKAMIDAMSKIPFFDKLGIGNIKVDMVEPKTPHAASDALNQMRQGLEDNKPEPPVLRQTPLQNYVNLGDSYNNYKQKGSDFMDNFMDKGKAATDKIKGLTNTSAGANLPGTAKPAAPKVAGNSTTLLANQYSNLNNVNRVNEVGEINEAVDISADDLKMLRELAEIQAIQNFVELTPTVQVTTGNINNAGDIDSIIAKINDKLQEAFVSTAQGVYT
ncbi:hypothetical protein [Paenibacillus tepidiphilus]|uniref:hypothetical protein n=1 Tax=Paenibacillus tepidiphilus TaxID=2608683 RepID=UPI00123BC219|nr:hypothetical protein [Paenibacillus tepidiphilus]